MARKKMAGDACTTPATQESTLAVFEHILAQLKDVRQLSTGSYSARCPVANRHRNGDKHPSLSLSMSGDGTILMHCHRGCSFDEICAALGISPNECFPKKQTRPSGKKSYRDIKEAARLLNPSAIWTYRLEDGSVAFHILRIDRSGKKRFMPLSPSGGTLVPKLIVKGKRPLFNLPSLASRSDERVYVVEGEKCAEAMISRGVLATTWHGGSSAWNRTDFSPLFGRDVVLLPDNDEPGRKAMREIAHHLAKNGSDVSTVHLSEIFPSLEESGDIADLLDSPKRYGAKSANDVLQRIEKAIPFAEKTVAASGGDGTSEEARSCPGGEPGDEHCTDLGNAKRLIRIHGRDIRFVPVWDKWIVWRGYRWAIDETNIVHTMARDVIADIYDQAHKTLERAASCSDEHELKALKSKAEQLLRHAKRSERGGGIAAAVRLAQSEPGISISTSEIDTHEWLLNTPTCIVDLRTGEPLPHRRDLLITKCTNAPYLPGARCDRFMAFLDDIFEGNEEVISFVQRAIGLSLIGKVIEHVMFICYGSGANGKSTLLETIMHVLGDYACTAAPDLLVATKSERHPTEAADLFGRRLVVCSEIEEGQRLKEGYVKRLVGGDTIKARRLYQDFFEFKPSHTVWLAVNSKPVIRGSDHAIWRRIRLIPFNVTIDHSKRNPHLKDELLEEAQGILSWCVQGTLSYLEHGLCPPAEVVEATDSYREDMDAVGSFLSERCIMHPDFVTPATELYSEYQRWCTETGERELSRTRFYENLAKRGLVRFKATSGPHRMKHCWKGIGIRQ